MYEWHNRRADKSRKVGLGFRLSGGGLASDGRLFLGTLGGTAAMKVLLVRHDLIVVALYTTNVVPVLAVVALNLQR